MRIGRLNLYEAGEILYCLIVINALMFLGALPLITIGSSFSAGLYAVNELRQGNRDRMAEKFIKKYVSILLSGSISWVITVLWLIILTTATEVALLSGHVLIICAVFVLDLEMALIAMGSLYIHSAQRPKHFIDGFSKAIVHGHVNWMRYWGIGLMMILTAVLILRFRLLLPVIFSGSMYVSFGLAALLEERMGGGSIARDF